MNKNINNLRNIFDEYVKDNKAVGTAVCVYKDGKEVLFHESGYADRERKTKFDKDTIFRCFSMSKPITAAAALKLVEKGILDIHDPVSKYLKSYGNSNLRVIKNGQIVPVNNTMTVYNLLNMTSGLVYAGEADEAERGMGKIFEEIDKIYREKKPVSTIDFADMIAKNPLAFEPGEHWRYGTSADVLGAVIEVASGMKFSEFLKKEIFDPLGMKDTGFFVQEKKRDRFSAVYEYINDDKCFRRGVDTHLGMSGYDCPPAFESGGAGLVSTIKDYGKFAMMLAAGGKYEGNRILSENTVRYMATNQLSLVQILDADWDSLRGYGYGNLCRIMMDTSRSLSLAGRGCFGWDGWTGNYFIVDPKENMALIYVMQKYDGADDSLMRRVLNVVYGSL